MNQVIDFLKDFDLHQILTLVVAVYLVTNYRFKKIDERFDQIDSTLKNINKTLISLDSRLTRLEGRFDERGYWESRYHHVEGERP